MHDVRASSGRTTSLSVSVQDTPALVPSPIAPATRPGSWLRRGLAALAATSIMAGSAAADPLRGRVLTPDGQPAAGVSVTVSGALAAPLQLTTGADGRFEADVPAGLVTVRAFATGLDASASRTVAGETTVDLQLQVRAVSELLTVTASPVDTPLSLAGPSVTVFTREDVQSRQLWTLGDALRLTPGFAVARTGGPGTVTSIFPRGGESDFTLVLVDGVRANAFGGGLDLSQVPIDDAARVEVVRGPQSALYGADAIGGVIQIVTARGESGIAQASAEMGGRDARNGALTLRAGATAWRAGLSVARQQDDGFTGTAPADGTAVTNDDSALTHASASLGGRATRGTDAGITAQYVDTDRGSPGPFGANPVGNFFGVDRDARSLTRRRSAAAFLVQPWGGPASRVRLRLDGDAADLGSEFRSAFGSRGSTQRGHGRLQIDGSAAASLSGSVGADVLRESGRNTFITAGAVEVPVERSAAALFAEGRWVPAARGAVTVGVRAERISRAALAANPSPFSPRPAFPDETIVAINPRVSAVWALVAGATADEPATRIRVAAGTGIRPPDAFEIAFTDNSGLKPERNLSSEIGLVQTLLRGTAQADVTAFHNRYDDLIVAVGRLARTSRYQTDNIANARARGVELALAWRPTTALSLRSHYTWLDTTVLGVDGAADQAPTPFQVGDPLLRRPRHQGGMDLSWQTARAQMFATATLRGETLDVEPNFGASGGLYANPGHAMITIGGAWTPTPRVSFYARVVNAGGLRYEDVLGYPALGRTAYAGIRVAARR